MADLTSEQILISFFKKSIALMDAAIKEVHEKHPELFDEPNKHTAIECLACRGDSKMAATCNHGQSPQNSDAKIAEYCNKAITAITGITTKT